MLLSLNQREAAEEAGINHAAVRLLERGEKKCIPPEYLQFLHKKGIDINWIFNDSSDISLIFRKDAQNISSEEKNGLLLNLYDENPQSRLPENSHNMKTEKNDVLYKCVFNFENDLQKISEQITKLNLKLSSFNF